MSWASGWMLLVAVGCAHPDPDARLRRGDLDGAARDWEALHGEPLDADHPVAEILAMRARSDASITTDSVRDAVDAARLLEQAPREGSHALDVPLADFGDWFTALDAIAVPPVLVAVGRSEGIGDQDPYTTPALLPWKGGRIVGWARTDLGALGRKIEANPPARLVVVAMRDATGSVFVNLQRSEGAWTTIAASRPKVAARLVLAADAIREYEGGASGGVGTDAPSAAPGAAAPPVPSAAARAEALRSRLGRGFVLP